MTTVLATKEMLRLTRLRITPQRFANRVFDSYGTILTSLGISLKIFLVIHIQDLHTLRNITTL